MDGADYCLIGIVLGARATKNIPQYQYHPIPLNIAQYPIAQCQYRSNPSSIQYKSKSVLLCLYKTLVRPHLEYCTQIWSPHYAKDRQLLEKVQHRFTRMVPGMKVLPYNERLRQLGLWTIEERRNRADLIEMFKMRCSREARTCLQGDTVLS